MATRNCWLACGASLALFACEVVRAEEPVSVVANSAQLIQPASAQIVVRRARRFWLFGGSARESTTTSAPATFANKSTAPTTAPAAPAAAPAIARPSTRPQDSQQPALSPTTRTIQPQANAPAAATELSANIFGSGAAPTSQLSQERRSRASGTGSDVVSGRESNIRATTDAGSLLGKSSQARGVSTQQRTPITTDTRIRGSGVGRMVASGG